MNDLFPTDYWDFKLQEALYGGVDNMVKAKIDARLGTLTVEMASGKPVVRFGAIINTEPQP